LSEVLLRRGSRVAVVSPASAAKAELVTAGAESLRAFGYAPVVMPHALSRGPLYFAGTAEERVADLHAAFADKSFDGLICTRGGWGSVELLPLLDRELIGANPKVFVGYSDHTSLHAWFWNEFNMPTVYGPMVAADWSHPEGADDRTWRAVVEGEGVWSVGAADGLRVLREGKAEGRLLGGCISILEAALGTPWTLKIDEPCVLFLEDIGVKPYQWDRMLQHLKFAGMLKHVRGVVLGDMSACVEADEMELLEAACLHALRDFEGPVAIGLRSGHVRGGNRSLPLGSWVRMEGAELTR
jgi:muramoyltetrapeptide carboxypeptidase